MTRCIHDLRTTMWADGKIYILCRTQYEKAKQRNYIPAVTSCDIKYTVFSQVYSTKDLCKPVNTARNLKLTQNIKILHCLYTFKYNSTWFKEFKQLPLSWYEYMLEQFSKWDSFIIHLTQSTFIHVLTRNYISTK